MKAVPSVTDVDRPAASAMDMGSGVVGRASIGIDNVLLVWRMVAFFPGHLYSYLSLHQAPRRKSISSGSGVGLQLNYQAPSSRASGTRSSSRRA